MSDWAASIGEAEFNDSADLPQAQLRAEVKVWPHPATSRSSLGGLRNYDGSASIPAADEIPYFARGPDCQAKVSRAFGMCTTIHYKLKEPKWRRRNAAFATVVELRELALKLPFHRVGQVVELYGRECNPEHYPFPSDLRGLALQGRTPDPECGSLLVRACRIIAFSTVPAPGSGPAYFGLARYPQFITTDRGTCQEKTWMTSLEGWSWTDLCETMSAFRPPYGGLGNFLRCHLTLVKLLDAASKLGVLRDVRDDSGYWETRNIDHLISRIGGWECSLKEMRRFFDYEGWDSIWPLTRDCGGELL